jgi:hypothetical protein
VASFSSILSKAQQTVNTVKNTTNAIKQGATVLPSLVKNLIQDGGKTGLENLIGLASPGSNSGNGPPYENILEQFSNFSSLWTLACLEPNQFNNPNTYRGNTSNLNNIIFSSAGRYDGQRVSTVHGAPEYFIDNFNFETLIAPMAAAGNTNVIKFSFEIYEPYSMGLFLQSLQVAAVNSGYTSYLDSTPYLLKLDFAGNTDDGSLINNVETLTKYFTIKITNVTMSVNESGSSYTVSAVPYHHLGFSDVSNTVKTSVKLTGTSVKDVLVDSSESFVKYLNSIEEEDVKKQQKSIADIYEIVFPTDSSDSLGVNSDNGSVNAATKNPLAGDIQRIVFGQTNQLTADAGSNIIAESSMNFSADIGGKFVYPKENETIDSRSGRTDKSKMPINPDTREFNFEQGDKINQIIQKVILVSTYAASAVNPSNIDDDGMVNWFRLDVQIQLLEYDQKRNTRARKYIFRIVPFKVNGYILKNPSAPTPGITNLAKKIAKRYDYIYTGNNNNILKFELEFNGMFFTGSFPRSPDLTGTNNEDTQNSTDASKFSAPVNVGGTSVVTSSNGSPSVQSDPDTVKSSPIGNKTIQQQVADAYQTAFLNSSRDLVNLEIEILGDPYFLSDSGINSNYFSKPGVNNLITADQSMNYEGSEIFIYLAFRTPVEPNLSVSKEGGLYDFPNSSVSPFSGIYKVIKVVNKFSSGNYTQDMSLVRVLGQPGDFEGSESIVLENIFRFGEPFTITPQATPASDPVTSADGEIAGESNAESSSESERLLTNTAGTSANANLRPSSSQTVSSSSESLSRTADTSDYSFSDEYFATLQAKTSAQAASTRAFLDRQYAAAAPSLTAEDRAQIAQAKREVAEADAYNAAQLRR